MQEFRPDDGSESQLFDERVRSRTGMVKCISHYENRSDISRHPDGWSFGILGGLMMKNIMVVGATGGIGMACAKTIDAKIQGGYLVLVGRDVDKLQKLQAELNADTVVISADVKEQCDIDHVFNIIRERNMKLDGFVYAAGIEGVKPLKLLSMDMMTNVMKTNCFGFIEMCKYMASKKYTADGCSIVAISSLAGSESQNYIGELIYCVSKAALNKAVKVIAKELLRRKIRVNAVLPATTDTAMIRNSYMSQNDEEYLQHITKNQPLGILQPNDIADFVMYLLMDQSKTVTGACIPINGGRGI